MVSIPGLAGQSVSVESWQRAATAVAFMADLLMQYAMAEFES